jgi:hypothetical protein
MIKTEKKLQPIRLLPKVKDLQGTMGERMKKFAKAGDLKVD